MLIFFFPYFSLKMWLLTSFHLNYHHYHTITVSQIKKLVAKDTSLPHVGEGTAEQLTESAEAN